MFVALLASPRRRIPALFGSPPCHTFFGVLRRIADFASPYLPWAPAKYPVQINFVENSFLCGNML